MAIINTDLLICRRQPVSVPDIAKETTKPILTIERPIPQKESDSDSDIEIIGGPPKVRALPLSPERAKIPAPLLSPTRPNGMTHDDLNRSLLGRISRDLLSRRKKLEDEARAQGMFTSAEERALRHLQKEKEAEIIDLEVQRRLLGGHHRRNADDDDSVPDEDDEDYLMQLSGQEEDEEGDGDIGDEDKRDAKTGDAVDNKEGDNKNEEVEEEDDDDDDDHQPKFGRRRIRSKRKTKDEDEDTTVRVPKKPEPAHSIANFFKAKNLAKVSCRKTT